MSVELSRTIGWCILILALGSFVSPEAECAWMEMTTIGNPGNPGELVDIGNPAYPEDDVYMGGVRHVYQIGTYEVTVGQYADFLNAKAASDPHDLYNPIMGTTAFAGSFLTRSGVDGSYTYAAVSGKEDQPVRWVSLYDSMRFCNWLSNGQGSGDTETGSYDMSLGLSTEREASASWVIPSEDEWYKAAYYDPDTGTYYDYPNGTDDVPSEPTDGTSPRVFNFGDIPLWQGTVVFTSTGDTTGQSPYGTYDQGGNVYEWTDTISDPLQGLHRAMMGGWASSPASDLEASGTSLGYLPHVEGDGFGFRVAFMVPEPSTVMLLVLGGLGCLLFRRR